MENSLSNSQNFKTGNIHMYLYLFKLEFSKLKCKVEIFLEQREVAFLSPSKICENLNSSIEIRICENLDG